MDGSVTVPKSVFCNGQWATAHWMADVVDAETGELIITATLAGEAGQGPVVTALRMNMDLARQLRAMAGFVPGETLEADEPCYDCRTTGERLMELERRLDELDEYVKGFEKATARLDGRLIRRIEAIEGASRSNGVYVQIESLSPERKEHVMALVAQYYREQEDGA